MFFCVSVGSILSCVTQHSYHCQVIELYVMVLMTAKNSVTLSDE